MIGPPSVDKAPLWKAARHIAESAEYYSEP